MRAAFGRPFSLRADTAPDLTTQRGRFHMPMWDYVVSRPNMPFDFGGGAQVVPHGVRLHGDVVEGWSSAVADRLVAGGGLTRVPHDPDADHFVVPEFAAEPEAEDEADVPEDADEGEDEPEDEPEAEDVAYPRHTGFGRYELSDGSTVRGKDAAIKAQAELEVDADADGADGEDDDDAPEAEA